MQIAIITPSSPCNPEAFEQGLDILRTWGHTILQSPNCQRAPFRYLAGTTDERLAELQWAMESPADLILAGRGGFGAHHLLPQTTAMLASHPEKALMGFSDITALHQLWLQAGFTAIHGPNVTTLAKLEPESLAITKNFLENFAPSANHEGQPLLGGNLAMLASLAGTPYLYNPNRPHRLFLEDVGERPYRLDRLLQQLLLSGYFEQVTQVFLGEFKDCEPVGEADYTALDVVIEFFNAQHIPCTTGFPTGHGSVNHPIILG